MAASSKQETPREAVLRLDTRRRLSEKELGSAAAHRSAIPRHLGTIGPSGVKGRASRASGAGVRGMALNDKELAGRANNTCT